MSIHSDLQYEDSDACRSSSECYMNLIFEIKQIVEKLL